MRSSERLPYWLSGGTESCGTCLNTYVLEMECRCVACDAGICIHCVLRARKTGEVLCPECHEAEGTG